MRILVLGAGVIGTTTAYWLAKEGHEVTVLDRCDGPAEATSYANGGQISAAHALPWSTPSTPRLIADSLINPKSPLSFQLSRDPAQWRFAWQFLRACRDDRHRQAAANNIRLALYSRAQLGYVRQDLGLNYASQQRGILSLLADQRALDQAAADLPWLNEFGSNLRLLDRAAVLEQEPALASTANSFAGAIYSPADESGDAHLFTRALAEKAKALGVRFLFGRTISDIVATSDQIQAVATDQGGVWADAYVVALGADASRLLRPLGLRLPIQPLKGYSVTLPVGGRNQAPLTSITDERRRIVISRLGDRLRAAGIADFVGSKTGFDERRARLVLEGLLDLFPDGGDLTRAEFWTGLRPLSADGSPLLGPTRYRNLWLNAGHGTYGWTMACGSAAILADLIAGRTPAIALTGLTLERFSRRRLAVAH